MQAARQDEEISKQSPPNASSVPRAIAPERAIEATATSSSPPSRLTAANISKHDAGIVGRDAPSERREQRDIVWLKTQVDQLEEQKQKLVEENRVLKKREEKTLWDKDEMQRKLENSVLEIKKVRDFRDKEIEHRRSTDARLNEMQRKLADQEKAFSKVQENLKTRLTAAEEKEKRDLAQIRALRADEADLRKKVEDEQDDKAAAEKARNAAMAAARQQEEQVRGMEDELEVQKQRYDMLKSNIDHLSSKQVDDFNEIERSHGLELERLKSIEEQLRQV